MAELATDEEKVEAIKRWWKANGVAVVGGVALGLGAVFGWRAWVDHQNGVRERASIAFEQVLGEIGSGDAQMVAKQADAIAQEYGSTPYAGLAQLAEAKAFVEAGDLEAASASLRSALEESPDPSLKTLAALRLARVLLASNQFADAGAVVDSHGGPGPFAGDFAALRGDIAFAEGRPEEAREAYRAALDLGASNTRIIQLKLDDLPAEDAS
jgi:predicted negative regulator of RcsB-dependent stress response